MENNLKIVRIINEEYAKHRPDVEAAKVLCRQGIKSEELSALDIYDSVKIPVQNAMRDIEKKPKK